MKLPGYLFFSVLAFSGVAVAGCADETTDDVVAATDGELQARAQLFLGEFRWDPTSTFTDFAHLYLNDDGSYRAEVEAALVNPNVRCVAFPCTQPEMGKWSTTKSGDQLKITFAPASKKPSRSYFATIAEGALSLTRNKTTTKLLLQKADPAACVVTGCSGEICADSGRVSPCIVQPEVACYKKTKCERQADGQCGWTITKAVTLCLKDL